MPWHKAANQIHDASLRQQRGDAVLGARGQVATS